MIDGDAYVQRCIMEAEARGGGGFDQGAKQTKGLPGFIGR